MLVLPLLLTLATQAPEAAPDSAMGDPKECRVVVDDMGAVGYRIGDAQQLAETTVSGLRKRLGHTGVVFEGAYKGAKKLKKMLGPNSENEIQDAKLKYYEAAMANAKFRVRVRFGKTKGKQWATLSCRNAKSPANKSLEERKFEGTSLREVREKMHEAMPAFCPIMDPPAPKPAARPGPTGSRKKKKEWTLPPPR